VDHLKRRITPRPALPTRQDGFDFRECVHGIRLCLSNTEDFLAEADLLSRNRHFRHSVGLLELAAEEMGKAQSIVWTLEDSLVLGRVMTLEADIFRKHPPKLGCAPKAWVAHRPRKERKLRRLLSELYGRGMRIRESSFYVDIAGMKWHWGNPDLEDEEFLAFASNELRIDCGYIEAQLKNLVKLRSKIKRYGLMDERTQQFIRQTMGEGTVERGRSYFGGGGSEQ
jgi:AbiV family abortive infection protein